MPFSMFNVGLAFFTGGPLTACWKSYQDALKSDSTNRFVPWCRPDGSYSPVQCYRSYCYCVNRDGQEIINTRTFIETGKPRCTYSSEFMAFLDNPIKKIKSTSLLLQDTTT